MNIIILTDGNHIQEVFGPVASVEVATKMGNFLVENRDEDEEWTFKVRTLQDLSEFFMELMEYRR